MAEEIACPACETPNDPWSEACEACGANLHDDAEAPVRDDASDGDEFVAPDADAQDSGGFEEVEEVQAYDEDNPDYGVDEELAADEDGYDEISVEADDEIHEAVEQGEDDLAEVPVEGYELAEDTGADEAPFARDDQAATNPDQQFAGHEHHDGDEEEADYDLEVIEVEEDDTDDNQPQDEQFDGGAPLDASSEGTFDSWDEDDVVADGGAALDTPFDGEDAFAEPADEMAPDSDAGFDNPFSTDSDAHIDEEFDEGFAADSDADFDEFAAADSEDSESLEDEAVQSEAEEEPPAPPELEAILNPERLDRQPIEPLPTPGPYAELATLSVFRGGEQLGEVAIDFNCTVLGVDAPADEDEVEELYELEAVEPVDAEADQPAANQSTANDEEVAEDQAFEDAYELEPIDDEDELDSVELDEESDWDDEEDDAFADSEVDEEPEAVAVHEDPDDLEEGPVIDLSQFGDPNQFARRHGYVFRQNKHYTLYVLSDMGTQVNDELLALGDYRELTDGDVIVLGGDVALKFNEPAA